jgi:hypothetical protein
VSSEPSLLRVASQWLVAIALTISITAFFVAVAGVQVTSRDTGERIQRRAAAVLTDLDDIMPGIESGLPEAANDAQGDTVLIPDYPIPVLLTIEEATTLKGAELRQRILDESGTILYEQGMSTWADADPEGRQQIDDVSTTGALYRGLDLVRDTTNSYFVILAVVLGVISVILGAALLLTIRSGLVRLLVIGCVLLVASMPGLAAAVGVRFAMKTAQTDADTFVEDMLQIGIDTMWLPIRMYLALSMVGFATVGIAALAMWWDSRPRPEPVTGSDLPGGGPADAGRPLP